MPDFDRPTVLSDHVELQRGNTYKGSLLGKDGPVLLGLASIQKNGGFRSDNLKTYGGSSDPRMLLEPGDIYVSLKDVTQSGDLLGAVARVPEKIKIGRVTQDTVKLCFKDSDTNTNYIYWVLRTPQYREYCRAHATGTTNLGFPREDFLAFPIPELSRGRSTLLSALQSLDDKVDLNRQTNETLEAMARALFKDWFVDFGPTRAKMAGSKPYLAPDLWALFPDKLDEATGLPEGWEEKPLDDIADFLNGLALQKFPASDDEDSLPVIKIAELRSGVSSKTNQASRKVPEKYIVQDGDFLFSWSGSLLAKFWTDGEGALNQHLFKVTSDEYPTWFFSQWIYLHLKEFQEIAASKATTMGHIQRGHLRAALVVCPPHEALSELGQIIGPLVQRKIDNELESRTLAQTRDLLLPKLMSGEIRLQNAEAAA